VPGILIASKWPVKMPERPLRLALAGVLALSGIKLLNVPQANWVLAIGLFVGAAALVVWAINAYVTRPQPVPARTFD
jgi:hypothetical protein